MSQVLSTPIARTTPPPARRAGLPVRMVLQAPTGSLSYRARRKETDARSERAGAGAYRREGGAWTLAFDEAVDARSALTARAHAQLGMGLLERFADRPEVGAILAALPGVRVELLIGHDHVLDVDGESRTLGLDHALAATIGLVDSPSGVTAAKLDYELRGQRVSLSSDEVLSGFGLVSALAHVYAAARLAGEAERSCLHAVVDFYGIAWRALPAAAVAARKLLNSPHLDSGNVCALFLESVMSAELALHIDGVDLSSWLGRTRQELVDLSARPDLTAAATAAFRWRDKWVTWVMGQDVVDVPYGQDAAFELLTEREGEDIDQKRRAVHQELLSTYDRETEGANIERLSQWVEQEGRMIVCGRISRAFGNQTQLLSAATYVDPTELVAPVEALASAAAQVEALRTQVARLSTLVLARGRIPLAQLRGALWHLEEGIRNHQSSATKKIQAEKEADGERLFGSRGLDYFQHELTVLASLGTRLFALANDVRRALERAPQVPAAFLILQQRFFPGETHLLALANANRDTHPGKIEQLRDLTRKGGHNRYASEGFGRVREGSGSVRTVSWISKCQHWIEAIPMFIKERVVKTAVNVGGQTSVVERIETEVDQRGMEAFFRYAAEFWAENCEEVADSEHVALAREMVVSRLPRATAELGTASATGGLEEHALEWTRREGLEETVGLVAAVVAHFARACADPLALHIEKQEVCRYVALREVLLGAGRPHPRLGSLLDAASVAALTEDARVAVASLGLEKEAERLCRLALRRRRPVSTVHILTTESAGMTEGYVQTWLETEMALYNVIKAHGWQSEVAGRVELLRTRVTAIAEKVIGELGMEALVQELMADHGGSRATALGTIMATHRPVAEEVARLIVLIEEEERQSGVLQDPRKPMDPPWVETRIAKQAERLTTLAVPRVVEASGHETQLAIERLAKTTGRDAVAAAREFVVRDADLASDLACSIRSVARQEVIEELEQSGAAPNLRKSQAECLRNYSQLTVSFARRMVVASHGAQALTENPLYNFTARGGKKRYHLLYTPSRVDLGAEEMDSIVRWNQWVGGADSDACRAGREFYSLINEAGVEVRPALAWQEIQKTSENANMTAGKAFANAVALLIGSVGEGDQQLMADQMSLRHDPDRGTPAASEGYGGYCVPKDGLFLAFVLELQNETKLRQMGVPPRMHGVVLALAREAILHRHDFESEFEWQTWVARKLLAEESLATHLSQFLGLRKTKGEDVLVFNVAKIADSIQALGQPWHQVAAGDILLGNLAARWAVEKMIVGGEQVQRFMVFYKAWMIMRCLREAGREGEGRVVMPAEYKTVQDIRYSGGIRIFEILAKTGEHLTYSLDEDGQNLVFLMMHGFLPLSELDAQEPLLQSLPEGSDERARRRRALERRRRLAHKLYEVFRIDESVDGARIQQLKQEFPSLVPPADLRLVSSTMASTQDVFCYTDDTQLTQIADQVKLVLADIGLTEDQMRANAEIYGGELGRWIGVKHLPEERRAGLVAGTIAYRVGADTFEVPMRGAIHALVLKLRGPGRVYEREVQGADVLNTSIAFKELRQLVDDPPKLVALMLEGNPQSALAITDGISGRGSRMLTYQDIMCFFAACEAIAGPRRGVYRAIGLGEKVVTRLRHEMHSKRRRAQQLFDALERLGAAAQAPARSAAIASAEEIFRRIGADIEQAHEADESITEEERTLRYGRHKARDSHLTQSLARVAAGLSLGQLDFGTWLAMGGAFVTMGMPKSSVDAMRTKFEAAVSLVPRPDGAVRVAARTAAEVDEAVRALVRVRFVPENQAFQQVLGRESSSKAVHLGETEARERRKALRERRLRLEMFQDRQRGFREALPQVRGKGLAPALAEARATLESLLARVESLLHETNGHAREASRQQVDVLMGRFLACAYQGIDGAVEELYPKGDDRLRAQKERFHANLAALYTGREIVIESWKKIAGGYQDMGDLARLSLAIGDDREKIERLASAIELFYVTLCLSQTIEHVHHGVDRVNWVRFWDDLAVFFADTLNDHDCHYLPWHYVRGVEKGVSFDKLSISELYALASQHHDWLYRYLRLLLTSFSELRQLPVVEQDALLGDARGGADVSAIGAGGESREERAWRAYNQLREIAFMRNDSFPVPVVFPHFDPTIIEGDKRVNMVFLFPVGRTHISRALGEGPTLCRDLRKEGRPGVNLIVSRYGEFRAVKGAKRNVLLVHSGHLYLSRSELIAALVSCKGLRAEEADAMARTAESTGALTPKGIRIAARFSRPIVAGALIPYHGNVLYTSGQMEDEGVPATVQSLVHSDITYDKSLYPEIYRSSGVEMPPEIDWLMPYQAGLAREEALRQIAEGRPGFMGLRGFSERHPIVLIKGAAESGARNLKVFEIGKGQGAWNEEELLAAAIFVYERAGKQNMVIQEAARTTPEFWASPEYMTNFVDRQILEWNAAVARDRFPRSQIYGSLRIIASSSAPNRPYDLTHLIALASLQVATNVGRGGTLEPLRDEFVQPEHRAAIRKGMADQVPLVMKALDRYAPAFEATFRARRGRAMGRDLRGISYGWPAYMMLDYLVTPVFERDGQVVDIEPRFDESGARLPSKIILEDGAGRFEGRVVSWRFIHLEPNVGIGLWDRYSLREQEWETRAAVAEGRPIDWDAIGREDRVVLRNFAVAGQEYIEANFRTE